MARDCTDGLPCDQEGYAGIAAFELVTLPRDLWPDDPMLIPVDFTWQTVRMLDSEHIERLLGRAGRQSGSDHDPAADMVDITFQVVNRLSWNTNHTNGTNIPLWALQELRRANHRKHQRKNKEDGGKTRLDNG